MNSPDDAEPKKKVRIVCISDTHNHGPPSGFQLPKGDILVHAGDLTNRGTYPELKKAARWLEDADFEVKIVVAGNHELTLDQSYAPRPGSSWTVEPEERWRCRDLVSNIPGAVYLEHSSTTITLPELDGASVKVFGSPYSPSDPSKSGSVEAGSEVKGSDCWAFQYPSAKAEEVWSAVPQGTDILITHSPPSGHCDVSKYWSRGGCPVLLDRIREIKPALHVCGHCHEGRGAVVVRWGVDQANSSDSHVEVESVRQWQDPGAGSKKQSLLDLTGSKGARRLERGRETAVVNASIMGKSWEKRGAKEMRKPIIIDLML